MKDLLIIDMQEVFFTPKTPCLDATGVIKRINLLSDKFRTQGDLVIFIQHDGSAENYCIPGSDEWQILPSLNIEPDDLIISKIANDAFYNTSLRNDLNKFGINEVVITGCATDFCVDATVKSALTNDLIITVISDGHTTADRNNLTARQAIDHYNWIWHEMSPTKGKIDVVSYEQYVKLVN